MNGSDPAFDDSFYMSPTGHTHDQCYRNLTKREYFAAMAMQGLRAAALSDPITESEQGRILWSSHSIALQAVSDADALIAALSKDSK